ncbi:alanine racemase [bacterium]|nr:alanine racemase [bacterium]
MHCQEIDTPALLIDLDRMQSNIASMADFALEHGVNLRPHTKTHKCPAIAKMQLEAGATGITCAKVSEAEVMAAAGLDDILIANEIIGEAKFKRLIELARKTKLCVAVDSVFGVESLNAALVQADQKLDVVIEINSGQNRCGVLPQEALELARTVVERRHLNLRGLMTHGGHAYNSTTEEDIKRIGIEEGSIMVETARVLRDNGLPVEIVSVGSSPTARYCGSVDGVTEIRPGTYIFNDLTQTTLFAADLNDCALSILATVTSRPTSNRVVVDAGKKALTSDPYGRKGGGGEFGLIKDRGVHISRLSEEHGVIETQSRFEIGEKVQIIPNHVCVVVNMFDQMYGVRNGEVETIFKVEGRGKMT